MFQEMINGSMAVITRPSVSTFEEHEKNNLGWALIYTLIGGVISAVLAAIRSLIFPAAALDPSTAAQLEDLGVAAQATASPGIGAAIIGALIGGTIGFFIYYGVVYLLGRAFGGTGQFGELSYDMSLFAAPFGVAYSVLSFIPFLGGIAGLALWIYSLYLTYLGIQSGMNLPSNKALYVILIMFAIGIGVFLCIVVFFAAIIAAIVAGSSGG